MKVKDKYLNFYYETIGEVPEPVIDPKKTALLIVDMQNQFVRRDSPEAEAFKAAENGNAGFRFTTGWTKSSFPIT